MTLRSPRVPLFQEAFRLMPNPNIFATNLQIYPIKGSIGIQQPQLRLVDAVARDLPWLYATLVRASNSMG